MSPPNRGDVLLITLLSEGDAKQHLCTLKWSQSFSNKEAKYYALVVKNKSKGGADVPVFIAAEWYTDDYLSKVGTKNADGVYELTIDDKFQYGQKNEAGEMRFVVFHDKTRKPYQHRFMETTIQSLAGGIAAQIAGALGQGATANAALDLAKRFVGDYLHTFN